MQMRTVAAVLLATLAACEPPAREPVRGADAAGQADSAGARAVVAQSRFHIAHPLYELRDSSARVERLREHAQGVVVPTYGGAVPHELNVVNDTAYEIQTVARVRFYPRSDGGWTDTTWTREPELYTELVRATQDDYGLPVTQVRGRWLRVLYAFAEDGSPRTGWVRLVPGRSVYHDRDQQLLEFSASLADPANTEFFDAPGGEPVAVDLRPTHTVRVLSIDGDWIQVALARPDTSACTGNENLQVRQRDTVWVRRYDERGRRQITSAVAGC